MSLRIDYTNLPDVVSEFENGKYTAFASDLGMRPGEWPHKIPTSLGNKLDFVAEHTEVNDGDLQWVVYRQAAGCISLKIFND